MTIFYKNPNTKYANVGHVGQLKYLNESNGYYFFSENTMRSFYSRVHSDIYGGCVFVTSEKQGYGYDRKYTVRIMHANGDIETCSSFGQYPTRYQAHTSAKHLVEHGYLTVI
jgi:hypothetical protein